MTRVQSIHHRLVLNVSLGLLAFAVLMGAIIYFLSQQEAFKNAASVEEQLVQTVQAQAEVAVFAGNAQIADGVIAGLRTNPRIRAVRIAGLQPGKFNASGGASLGRGESFTNDYPLFSPVDGKERIGTLSISRNESMIRAEAILDAMRETLLMLAQIVAGAVLMLLFSRRLIGKPVADLAQDLSRLQPGSGERVSVPDVHAGDEIGLLANHINKTLESAEKALNEVRALATTDSLTGLLSRRAFMVRLENELARTRRYEMPSATLLMLDLDHFKQVNDRHGHAAGDAVLAEFGRIVARELRQVDAAGRIGGEEFAILLPATQMAAAAVFAERLRQNVAGTEVRCGEAVLHMTVSIGTTQVRNSDQRPEDALVRADQALYRAKDAGRNRVESAPDDDA